MVRPNGQAPRTIEELCHCLLMDGDTLAIQDETSRNISSTCTTENPEVVRQLEMMNKNFLEMMRQFKTVKTVDTKCETYGGLHSFTEWPAIGGYTQETAYANTGNYNSGGGPRTKDDNRSVVDYVVDPRVTLILERPFLRTERALIDVYGEELTLRIDDEAITFKVGQTLKYSYNDGFSNNSKSGNPTPISDPIIALSSPSLTPFDGGDFILEEIEACLTSKSIPSGIDDTDLDLEGDIRLLEEFLNNDPSSSPLHPKELNVEIKTVKSSIDEPPELELKDLPSHLEYVFLEGTDKLPIIISNELKDEEKSALLKVLKSYKRAIAWKIFDIKKLTLRVDDEAITFKVGQTSKYSYNDDESTNRVDVINVACEEYVQEVLGFSDNSKSGNPTLISDLIIALSSPSLTPFKGVDFILEEIKACLTSKSIPPRIDDTDLNLEGDIRILKELLNNDPSLSPLPPKELNVEEIKTAKSSIDEPPELELKDLPSHLEYAYLEGTDKLPMLIEKGLKDVEKESLFNVLTLHKQAIAWKISDIKGIDPCFCTQKVLMEDDFKPTVQSQRRVNPKIHKGIKKEVIKLLDARLIYPIFDSPW
nr:reverse transcriptase domain-containing protein [Tanacetum cinerariifolium]